MFLRSLSVAAGAALLMIAVPGSATAAGGQFRYSYTTADGYEATGFLTNPASEQCINLAPAASEPGAAARAPKNHTDATATVFLGTDCEGDTYYTLPPGKGASDRLLVRSVVFS
ncbi:hypothetical protein [Streptomyces sp. NPDC046939]|uniref:hypothetical protein n=1 Tax=Streptomyces sp. NPDC046939 TaxID=3155376 RepID=UPI003408BCCF